MATMNVSLPEPMKAWVERQAAGGRYGNASDYVRDLIRRDQQRAEAIAALQALSRPRQAYALRHWLASLDAQGRAARPSSAQLQALLSQIDACRTRAHRIELKVGRGQVRREADVLRWYNDAPSPQAPPIAGDSGLEDED